MSYEQDQTERHPSSYNKDERERKIEQERQLVSLEAKVDRLLIAVSGDDKGTVIGLSNRIVKMEHEMWGTDEHMGMVTKVTLIWKTWIWLACTASAIAGGALTQLARYIFKI